MATKKKNLRQQMRSELYAQYDRAKGQSRHEEKERRRAIHKIDPGAKNDRLYDIHGHLDRIPSQKSLKAHLDSVERFSEHMKQNFPEVKRMSDITHEHTTSFLQERRDTRAPATVAKEMSSLNHLLIGSQTWESEDHITKDVYELKSVRADENTNNRGETRVVYNDYQQKIVDTARAFGYRSSEVQPVDSGKYSMNTNSLYEKDERIYAVTVSKGGKYRASEVLKSHESFIRDNYGEHIQKVDELPTKAEYRASVEGAEPFFRTVGHEVRIHADARQYYANEKLAEIEAEGRRFELSEQNKTPGGKETYTTNGREMLRDQAQFISENLGHNRIYVLKNYINLQ